MTWTREPCCCIAELTAKSYSTVSDGRSCCLHVPTARLSLGASAAKLSTRYTTPGIVLKNEQKECGWEISVVKQLKTWMWEMLQARGRKISFL